MDSHPMFKELWKFNLASQQWKLLETVGDSPNESVSYGRESPILFHSFFQIRCSKPCYEAVGAGNHVKSSTSH